MKKTLFPALAAALVLAACGTKTTGQAEVAAEAAAQQVVSSDIAYVQVEAVLAQCDLYKNEGVALQEKTEKADIMPIVLACMSMSKGKVGALIVIEKSMPLNDIIRTGEIINANVNQRLIENIFFKNSPLHDGAMIIRHKRIEAAGCILPVSHDLNIPKELGLRHRAAMGVSQETDALAIIVSEETGGISVAYKGQFHLRLTAEELERILTKEE